MDEQIKVGGAKKWWVAGIIIVVLVVIGLIKGPTNKETIKIGAVLPLTGKIAPVAQQIKNGFDLAMADLNSANDRKIEAIYEDSQLDAKTGISAVNKLVDVDGVKYIHVAASPIISAVQPITEKRGIVMTGVSQSPSILKDTKHTLRVFFNLDQAMDKFVEYVDSNGYKKVVVLYVNIAVMEDQMNYLEKQGLKPIDKVKYNIEDKDFKTILLKIKLLQPDLIITMGYGSELPIIFKQANELGLSGIPVLGTLSFLEAPKDSLSLYGNVAFLVPAYYLGQTDVMKKFTADYINKFGIAPDHQAAYAYDTANLLYKGISKTDGSPDMVMNFLRDYGDYEGVAGKLTLQGGDTKGELSFAKYVDGKIVPYK